MARHDTHPPGGAEMATTPVDMRRRLIRATGWRSGFIEFEFTIGDPLLTVELIMPPPAFVAFCAAQGAQVSWADGMEHVRAQLPRSIPAFQPTGEE